ncbi:MAG: hypothetical protein ACE37K_17285 [Planctomycetota bacterium]
MPGLRVVPFALVLAGAAAAQCELGAQGVCIGITSSNALQLTFGAL